jgi:Fe-S-cluster containining protein
MITSTPIPLAQTGKESGVRETIHLKILQLYEEADSEVKEAGPLCVASGRCCRFKEFGHVLYLSNLEADLLLSGVPVEDRIKPEHLTGEFCPYQKDNLCTAREPRPLSCRIYYCDPNYQQKASELTEKYLRRLKELAEDLQVEWNYAPLHHFLKECGEGKA